MPRARVITGAVIVSDDDAMQFEYKEKCPYCGEVFSDVHCAIAYPGSPFVDQFICYRCQRPFDIRIERD